MGGCAKVLAMNGCIIFECFQPLSHMPHAHPTCTCTVLVATEILVSCCNIVNEQSLRVGRTQWRVTDPGVIAEPCTDLVILNEPRNFKCPGIELDRDNMSTVHTCAVCLKEFKTELKAKDESTVIFQMRPSLACYHGGRVVFVTFSFEPLSAMPPPL